MPTREHERGFTVIELTVVIAVLVTLVTILTPSIADFIADARVARATVDVQTIASAVVRFHENNGFFPQWSRAAADSGPGAAGDRVDVLIGPGEVPIAGESNPWTTRRTYPLSSVLIANDPGYPRKTPSRQFGWRGPYLSSEINADPWHNRYMVNIGLIDLTEGAEAASGEVKSAVWVISAGRNGVLQTEYAQPITSATRRGDDIGVRIQ